MKKTFEIGWPDSWGSGGITASTIYDALIRVGRGVQVQSAEVVSDSPPMTAAEMKELGRRFELLNNCMAATLPRIGEVENEMKALKEMSSREIERPDKKVDKLENEGLFRTDDCLTLKSRVGALERDLEAMKAIVFAMPGPKELRGMKEQMDTVPGKLREIRDIVAASPDMADSVRASISSLAGRMQALEGGHNTVIGRVDRVIAEVDRLRGARIVHCTDGWIIMRRGACGEHNEYIKSPDRSGGDTVTSKLFLAGRFSSEAAAHDYIYTKIASAGRWCIRKFSDVVDERVEERRESKGEHAVLQWVLAKKCGGCGRRHIFLRDEAGSELRITGGLVLARKFESSIAASVYAAANNLRSEWEPASMADAAKNIRAGI